MNILDVFIIAFMLIATVVGYRAGLIRSLATILAYVVAAPVAVALTPRLAWLSPGQPEFVFAVVFIVAGLLLGALMRSAASEISGEHNSAFDSVAGALLGAARIGLLAVLMVLIFDYIIPQNRQPSWLKESRLAPPLLAAGQAGLRKLPPDIIAHIDRMKRQRGL